MEQIGKFKLRKSGFTLIEFIITITIMLTVMALAFPILFKKTTKERENKYVVNGEIVCTQAGCTIKTPNQEQLTPSGLEFTLTQADKPEFVTIRTVGGGGGGAAGCSSITASCKGGNAGEIKTIVYPSLEGRYRAVIGNGGAAKNNGSASALYQSIAGNNWQLITSARGGISSNESAIGAGANLGEQIEYGNGNGGDAGTTGAAGEIRITW